MDWEEVKDTSFVNKGFIMTVVRKKTFSCGTIGKILSGQEDPILPACVANQNTRFA